MSLFQPSELIKFLASIGHDKPSKRLSQNFLIDGNILKKILSSAHVKSQEVVVEIGPGPGVLTEALLAQGAHVIAIEKDPLFAQALHRLQTSDHRLHVFQEDVLDFPLEATLKKHLKSPTKAKVISNLPYHLTSPIFGKLLPLHTLIDTVVVMIQKEVAERVTAVNGSKNYGSFSVFTQFYSHPTLLFSVSPHCFYPKPKVTSAVVRCELHPPLAEIPPEAFFEFVKKIFSMRRKMLTTSLKELCAPHLVRHLLEEMHLDPQARPEELSLDALILLFKKLVLDAENSDTNTSL